MPKEFAINKKVEVKIQRILSELISLKISDPRLKNIIISEVKVNRDISSAKVYFLVLNNENKTKQINSILVYVFAKKLYISSSFEEFTISEISPSIKYFLSISYFLSRNSLNSKSLTLGGSLIIELL